MPAQHTKISEPSTPEQRRLDALGLEHAGDVELLAMVLGGKAGEAKARALLQDMGGLLEVQRASVQRLQRVPGIGPAAARAVRAAFELSRRAASLDAPYGREIRSSSDVADFLCSALGDAGQETFLVLGLDHGMRLRLVRTVGLGSLHTVCVAPREVFRPLIEAGMSGVILVHNHPSGDPEPSTTDVQFTERLVEVGRMVGIQVLDHIVVTRRGITSLGERGLLPLPH